MFGSATSDMGRQVGIVVRWRQEEGSQKAEVRIQNSEVRIKIKGNKKINIKSKSKVKGSGQECPRATWGMERLHAVGFTGTGYQRSLRVHENDEYNF